MVDYLLKPFNAKRRRRLTVSPAVAGEPCRPRRSPPPSRCPRRACSCGMESACVIPTDRIDYVQAQTTT
jgi:hypothetical protein